MTSSKSIAGDKIINRYSNRVVECDKRLLWELQRERRQQELSVEVDVSKAASDALLDQAERIKRETERECNRIGAETI